MSFSVEWSKTAAKQLLKIPKKQRLIILSWVQDYLDEYEDYLLFPCAKSFRAQIAAGARALESTASWGESRMGRPSSRS